MYGSLMVINQISKLDKDNKSKQIKDLTIINFEHYLLVSIFVLDNSCKFLLN